MDALTEKQRKALGYIEGRLSEDGPPSQREIARHFGLAQNAVHQLIGYLKKKRYLEDAGGHRGLRLSRAYMETLRGKQGIAIVGRVAAGEPILAEENIEGYINPDELIERDDETFMLKVVGDSMVDDGILEGDYVAVRPTREVRNGQIAVVLLGSEATVKRVFFQRGRIALRPANKSAGYRTRYVKNNDKGFRIIGKVTACIRKL